jgi:hypothetical protein
LIERRRSRLGRAIVGSLPAGLVSCVLSCVLLAGCSNSSQIGLPSTTTTAAFTHAQVLGWVTPTLTNGIAFVGSISRNDSPARMSVLSRPLRTAALVSRQELAEVPWTGGLRPREEDLVTTLVRLTALTATAPGPRYREHLEADIERVEGDLKELNRAVNH